MSKRIAIVTCRKHPNLFKEEQQLPPLFLTRGIEAQPVLWDDETVAWQAFDLVLLRSTWDYCENIAAFKLWLERLQKNGVRTLNSVSLIKWNLDKFYLEELAAKGVRIIPTQFIKHGQHCDLAKLVKEQGWAEAIIKPSVSAGAYRTVRFSVAEAGNQQVKLDQILQDSGALIQPFFQEIIDDGECSLLFFNGSFSHAVIKTPKAGDFRIQTQFGGAFEKMEPPQCLVLEARAVLNLLSEMPAYARVDGVMRGEFFYLMEVEMIEPYLYLSAAPESAERFVTAIVSQLVK